MTKREYRCVCEFCGEGFIGYRSTAKYCPPPKPCRHEGQSEQRTKAPPKKRTCASCGVSFETRSKNVKRCAPCIEADPTGKGLRHTGGAPVAEPEVEFLRRELQRLQSEVRQEAVGKGWQQELMARCVAAVEAVPAPPAYKPPKLAAKKPIREDAVLLLSDTHIGEVVSPEETAGLGHYDFTVFTSRMEYLADSVRRYLTETMSGYQFDALRVFMLGDMVSGTIHEEIAETNELTIVDQVFAGALVFAQMLREWAPHFPLIEVTGIVGNHPRMKPKPYMKQKFVNFDWILYEVLAAYMRDVPNVRFDIPRSFLHTKEVRGHRFVLLHGDGIRSSLSIPLYGVNRRAANLSQILGDFPYLVMGHFHELAQLKSWKGERIINGATKGADEYALMMGLASEPVQMMFGVHSQYGLTWRLPMNLRFAGTKPKRYTYDIKTPPHQQIPA